MSKIYRTLVNVLRIGLQGKREDKLKEERKKIQSSLSLFSERYPIRFKRVKYASSENPETPIKSEDKTITIFTKHRIF